MNAIADFFFSILREEQNLFARRFCELLEKFVQNDASKVIGFGVYVQLDEETMAPPSRIRKKA
jgi:hypothetical protein